MARQVNTWNYWRHSLLEVLAAQFDGHPRPDWEAEMTRGQRCLKEKDYVAAAGALEAAAAAMYVHDTAEMAQVHEETGLHPEQLKPLKGWAEALEAQKDNPNQDPSVVSRLLSCSMSYLFPLLRSYARNSNDFTWVDDFKRRLDICERQQALGVAVPAEPRARPLLLAQEMDRIFNEIRQHRAPPKSLREP
ncbi:MAG: hypothetical protein ACJ8AT_26600 [Hyalangium sp.]|uniref:hypothetical protein n=1 Tax=Hyalangium sp. TaxID=2028555 RepID=UPI00389ADF2A